MLNEVKHLANVSCQVPARDSSDATLCQNDTQRGKKAFMDNIYIIAKSSKLVFSRSLFVSLLCSEDTCRSLQEKNQVNLFFLARFSYLYFQLRYLSLAEKCSSKLGISLAFSYLCPEYARCVRGCVNL